MELDYGILKYVFYVFCILLGYLTSALVRHIYWKGYNDCQKFIYKNYNVIEKKRGAVCHLEK